MLNYDNDRYPDGVCRNTDCKEHPHCVCGARLDDDGSLRLVCPDCGGDVLIADSERGPAEVSR